MIYKRYRPLLLILFIVAIMNGCHRDSVDIRGAYALCREMAMFTGEVIEIRDNHFLYWKYSDVVQNGVKPKYPITGWYEVKGEKVFFHSSSSDLLPPRVVCIISGHMVLLKQQAYSQYRETGFINPYDMLVRIEGKSPEDLIMSPKNYTNLIPKNVFGAHIRQSGNVAN